MDGKFWSKYYNVKNNMFVSATHYSLLSGPQNFTVNNFLCSQKKKWLPENNFILLSIHVHLSTFASILITIKYRSFQVFTLVVDILQELCPMKIGKSAKIDDFRKNLSCLNPCHSDLAKVFFIIQYSSGSIFTMMNDAVYLFPFKI